MSGTTEVSGGTVTLGSTAGVIPVASNQTLNLGTANGYALAVGSSLAFSNSGTIIAQSGLITLQSSNLSYTGGTFSAANGGTLELMGPLSSGLYEPQAGSVVYLGGRFSGSVANLVSPANAILALANNVSSGTLNVAGGTYVATANNAFGPATLSFNAGTLAGYGSSPITLSSPLAWGTNPTINFAGATQLNLTAPLALAGGTYNVNDPATVSNFSGVISGPGPSTSLASPPFPPPIPIAAERPSTASPTPRSPTAWPSARARSPSTTAASRPPPT